MTDAVARCARNAAAWHAAWLSALGLRSEETVRVWRALDVPPPIYWAAITLDAEARADDVRGSCGAVCDAWSSLDLAPLGFAAVDSAPWFARAAGALEVGEAPPELDVVRVTTPAEVEEFERVSMRGFVGEAARVEPNVIEPGSIHPPAILADRRMTMLIGRVAGRAVAAAMRYDTDDAAGIYGVTTVASMRGRGYASALTSCLVDPSRPTTLSPSKPAENLYRRLGFARVGELRTWTPLK